MKYLFLDESGSIGAELIVVGLVVSTPYLNDKISRAMKGIMDGQNSLNRVIPRNRTLRASISQPELRYDVIQCLRDKPVLVQARALDPPLPQGLDSNDAYNALVALAIGDCVERHGDIHTVLHKRYISPTLTARLEKTILTEVARRKRCLLTLKHTDLLSKAWGYQLVAADNIVWAVHRKLAHGDSKLYDSISNRIEPGGVRRVTIGEILQILKRTKY